MARGYMINRLSEPAGTLAILMFYSVRRRERYVLGGAKLMPIFGGFARDHLSSTISLHICNR